MEKREFCLSLRVTTAQHEKLLSMARETGTNRSWVLRQLIEDSELIPPRFVAKQA